MGCRRADRHSARHWSAVMKSTFRAVLPNLRRGADCTLLLHAQSGRWTSAGMCRLRRLFGQKEIPRPGPRRSFDRGISHARAPGESAERWGAPVVCGWPDNLDSLIWKRAPAHGATLSRITRDITNQMAQSL